MPTDTETAVMASEETLRKAEEAVRNWPYQNHRAVMLIYDEKNTVIFPEEFLGRMYMRLKTEGLLDVSFPGMKLHHLNRFITFMANIRLGAVVCCLKTPTKPKPVGWGYLIEVEGDEGVRRASFGFGFYREIHGRREHVDLSWMMLAYWFREFKIDQLYGTTLNPLAFNYSKRFGFSPIGTLPKFFNGRDARLITLNSKTFDVFYERWKMTSTPPQVEATLSLV
jgi:hypothetical protein